MSIRALSTRSLTSRVRFVRLPIAQRYRAVPTGVRPLDFETMRPGRFDLLENG